MKRMKKRSQQLLDDILYNVHTIIDPYAFTLCAVTVTHLNDFHAVNDREKR